MLHEETYLKLGHVTVYMDMKKAEAVPLLVFFAASLNLYSLPSR